MALVFGVLFYYLLLIKDLLLIDRRSARILLSMALSFLILRQFYLSFSGGLAGWAMVASFFIALMCALLLGNVVENVINTSANTSAEIGQRLAQRRHSRIMVLMATILFSQCILVALFLPLNFIYQALVVFLPLVAVLDLAPEYLLGTLSRGKVRTTALVVFAMLILVLTSAKWIL